MISLKTTLGLSFIEKGKGPTPSCNIRELPLKSLLLGATIQLPGAKILSNILSSNCIGMNIFHCVSNIEHWVPVYS